MLNEAFKAPVARFVRSHGILLLACVLAFPCAAEPGAVRARYIDGLGGVPLNVVEAGNPDLPTIIFIHGLGQSHLSWKWQLESSLAEEFHLVAYDLRGHGNSGKPWQAEDYNAPATWSGDLDRVIRETAQHPPLLVAWSFGTWVAMDYLTTHDAENIAGLVLVGALGGLVPMTPSGGAEDAARGKEIRQRTASGLLDDNFAAGEQIVTFFVRKPVDPVWTRRTGAANALLPPYVRPLITRRSFDHSAAIARIQVPTWVVVGSEDPQVTASDARNLVAMLPDAFLSVFDGSGHLPFAEDSAAFNRQLALFAARTFAGR